MLAKQVSQERLELTILSTKAIFEVSNMESIRGLEHIKDDSRSKQIFKVRSIKAESK